MPYLTSYAGNFEDVLLSRVFRDVEVGFYVDIGACDARFGSTSYVFYERGWTGINVEPSEYFNTLTAGRPRDINIKAAVTDIDGEVEFFFHRDNPATSTVSRDLSAAVSAHVHDRVAMRVPSIRMSTLVERYIGTRPVQFLKVDAEGSEPAIFGSCDWSTFRPEVIVSEAVLPYTNTPAYGEWAHHLTSAGYRMTLFDGISAWFVREESPHLVPLASLPVNQLDYFTPYDAEKESMQQELATLRSRLNAQ